MLEEEKGVILTPKGCGGWEPQPKPFGLVLAHFQSYHRVETSRSSAGCGLEGMDSTIQQG